MVLRGLEKVVMKSEARVRGRVRMLVEERGGL